MLATQIVGRIRSVLNAHASVRDVFEAPTVAELAESVLGHPANRELIEQIADLVLEIASVAEAALPPF